MNFTEELRHKAGPIWEGWHKHPFVRGIGDGSLDIAKFKFWIKQDYLYLKDYGRVFALGAAKAQDLETMSVFAKLLDGTLNTEMGLHRKYASGFGISEDELENEVAAPATQAYRDFLMARSYGGDLAELLAALLPCTWGFWEIGTRLKENGDTSSDNPYGDWIEMYSSQEFTEFYHWCRDLTERLSCDCPTEKKQLLEEIFITSSRYEYIFWDMCYEMKTWPV